MTLSKNKHHYYKIIDFIDEKLVLIDSHINRNISHTSKFALFINDEYIFFFGKGKIKEIKGHREVVFDSQGNTNVNAKYILNGNNLDLKEGDNILIPFKHIKKGEYIIIKDIHNSKMYLYSKIKKKMNETHYEIQIENINNTSHVNSTNIPVGEKFFKIEKRKDIHEKEGNVEEINKSKRIKFDTNIEQNLLSIYQLSQITIHRSNLNIHAPYKLFDVNSKNNQVVFHFVLKKLSQWKESYINLCLSPNETCTDNDIEIIIHSKKGILIHKPKDSAEKVIKDTLIFHSNNIMSLFTEKIICDIILVNSSLYFNIIEYSEYSSIRLKYKFKEEDFDKIKYLIISP